MAQASSQTNKPKTFWNEKNREALAAYGFLAPFVFTIVVFFGYAFVRTIYYSFTDYDLFKTPNFVGLDNYKNILTEQLFNIALANTLLFSLIVTTLQTIGALVLAVVLNQKLRGMLFFRTAYYMPSITSSVVITLIFIWLFRPTGIFSFLINWFSNHSSLILVFIVITAVLQAAQVLFDRSRGYPATAFDPAFLASSVLVGLVITLILNVLNIVKVGDIPAQPLNWIATREKFLGIIPYPLLVIMIQNTFTTIPTLMLFFLAGLQGVSKSLYEASSIDGATPQEQLRYITIPALRPVTFYVVTVGVIGTLQMFDQVSIFEGANAPLESTVTLAFYVFKKAFDPSGLPKIGLATAGAIFLAVITTLMVMIQRRFVVSDTGS